MTLPPNGGYFLLCFQLLFIMFDNFVVVYRYYATDDGHCHWTDSSESFASFDDAQQFIDVIDARIANGDPDVRPGFIVAADDIPRLPLRW